MIDRVLITPIPREDVAFRQIGLNMGAIGPIDPISAALHKYV